MPIYLTKAGKEELEKKLEELTVVRRHEVADKLKTAREHGDLSENAEYDAAKEEQAMVEGEILEIERQLRDCEIIEDNVNTGVVSVGRSVKLYDYDFDEEVEYQIVGTTEADPEKGKISNESPIGKGLLGKRKGKEVSIETPGGIVRFKILEIK